MQEFQLRIIPLKDNNFALELYQLKKQEKKSVLLRIGRIKGQSLILVRQAIYQTLKTNNYDPKTLSYKKLIFS